MKNFALTFTLAVAMGVFLFPNLLKAQNDITLDSCNISFQAWFDTAYFDDGFYSNRPVNQIIPVAFKGNVENTGVVAQTNVSFTTEVHDPSMVLLYSQSDTLPTFPLTADTWFSSTNTYTPAGENRSHISMFCNQAEVDQFPANNIADTIRFNTSLNKRIYRARDYNDNFSPAEYPGFTDGAFAGIHFYIPNDDTIFSISTFRIVP